MTAAVQPYTMSVDEFIAFCATDPARYERFELVNGQIWEPMPESGVHADLVESIVESLRRGNVGRQVIRSHGSVQLDGDGLVLPDVYVVAPGEKRDGDYWNGRQLDLVIEVALTTWKYDTGEKLRNYAVGGVPVVYVVRADQAEPEMHVFRRPLNGRYQSGPTIEPLSILLEDA